MVINNKPGKKDKKTLDFLKPELIKTKMIGHSISLAKKTKFYRTCSKGFTSALMAYLQPSSKVVDYPDTVLLCFATYLLSDDFFEFCYCLWIVMVNMDF